MAQHKSLGVSSRYEQIALDLASRIIRDEYKVGEKIFGRSTLAGRYKVSPETIRRAVALLQDAEVVETAPGMGIIIRSKRAAESYFNQFRGQQALADMQKKLRQLFDEKRRLDREIETTSRQMVSYLWGMLNNLQYLEKVEVGENSCLLGHTLASGRIRTKTGATVVAIERDDQEYYSPSSEMVFKAGDLLHVVGTVDAKSKLRRLVEREG
ncbi:MAG TPA: TrkA C-terminal domain-containing protein [bacterium]|nr:TrkA C-terminal domain-containing protein [bacterium]